jgi:hypothetical protein
MSDDNNSTLSTTDSDNLPSQLDASSIQQQHRTIASGLGTEKYLLCLSILSLTVIISTITMLILTIVLKMDQAYPTKMCKSWIYEIPNSFVCYPVSEPSLVIVRVHDNLTNITLTYGYFKRYNMSDVVLSYKYHYISTHHDTKDILFTMTEYNISTTIDGRKKVSHVRLDDEQRHELGLRGYRILVQFTYNSVNEIMLSLNITNSIYVVASISNNNILLSNIVLVTPSNTIIATILKSPHTNTDLYLRFYEISIKHMEIVSPWLVAFIAAYLNMHIESNNIK